MYDFQNETKNSKQPASTRNLLQIALTTKESERTYRNWST